MFLFYEIIDGLEMERVKNIFPLPTKILIPKPRSPNSYPSHSQKRSFMYGQTSNKGNLAS